MMFRVPPMRRLTFLGFTFSARMDSGLLFLLVGAVILAACHATVGMLCAFVFWCAGPWAFGACIGPGMAAALAIGLLRSLFHR